MPVAIWPRARSFSDCAMASRCCSARLASVTSSVWIMTVCGGTNTKVNTSIAQMLSTRRHPCRGIGVGRAPRDRRRPAQFRAKPGSSSGGSHQDPLSDPARAVRPSASPRASRRRADEPVPVGYRPLLVLSPIGRFSRHRGSVVGHRPDRDPAISRSVEAIRTADLVAATLPRYAGIPWLDPRAPQNLQPVGALERHLRHSLGDSRLASRAVRESVARLTHGNEDVA